MEPGPSVDDMLLAIAEGRARDPLAPVTVICPSHLAALQLRRRLAQLTPFAAVRFETLPRLAELIGAGRLAASGRRPMARPIGDHLAEQVAAQARPPLDGIAGLPGFARVLRRLFTRLRAAGLTGDGPPPGTDDPHLREIVRLFGEWRARCAPFYDPEDLLDAAAVEVSERPQAAAELGDLHLVPPGPRTHAGLRLLEALRAAQGGIAEAADPPPCTDVRMILAPDLASEVREAVRATLAALEAGVALDEAAVLTGADPAYLRPLREAFEAAGVPIASSPGVALSETPAGRGILALLEVAIDDLSRTSFVDALGVAPLRRELPAGDGTARLATGRWDRLSRAAGITHGIGRWRDGIRAWCDEQRERRRAPDAGGGAWMEQAVAEAQELLQVVETLWRRLDELRDERPAAAFLERFRALVADYLDPGADGTAEVLAEVERLGTIDAVGGTFDLTRFHRALRINLDAAALRDGRAGEGVLVADHRIAGGLRFRHAVICGAAEGLLPAGPGPDALVDDAPWAAMAAAHPLIDHAARRLDRARAAAHRAVGCADTLVLTCPLYEAAGAHERYPSPLAVEVMRARMPDLATAGALRAAPPSAWVHRPASPLAAHLRGPVLDRWEAGLREAVARVGGAPAPSPDPLARALTMVRARAGRTLTEWDGHLGDMAPSPWLAVPDSVSPTRLEAYGRCGFRFMLATLLRVRVPEEPADPETIDPLVRGGIVHTALERFLRGEIGRGRPAPGEAWTDEDAARLLGHLDDALEEARRRGVGGLPVFTRHEERRLRADLVTFLAEDSAFRRETRATPAHVEERIDAVGPHGQRFHGYADRIDRGADGTVWVIDYKTGRPPGKDDALGGGTLLQRPVYLLSVPPGVPAVAVYWYISARGGFLRDEWHRTPENDAAFDAAVGAIRDGVAAGAFPAVPGAWDDFFSTFANCGRCDFTRICSRSREDDFTRKQGDAAVLRWQAVTGGDGGG